MVGDYDCDATPQCDVFFPKPNNPKVAPTYAQLASGFAQTGKWSTVEKAKFSGGTLVLTTDWGQRGGAFSNAPILPVTEPWQLEFEFEVAVGASAYNTASCGFGSLCSYGGNGFALVLSPDRKTALGAAGSPWGQGYKGMPGESVGIVFETEYKIKATQYQYGDEMIAIVRNAYTDKVCNTPDSDRLGDGKPGCTTDADGTKRGVLIKTFDTAGMLLRDKSRHKARLTYDAIRHYLFVHLHHKQTDTWEQVLQGHMDFKEVFGSDIMERGLHVGFTASTTKYNWASFRIHSLAMRASTAALARTRLMPDGETVGSLHDVAAYPFHFVLDLRDGCDHPRLTGGETLRVSLTTASIQAPLRVPSRDACSEKPGQGVTPGVCDRGNGIYDAYFDPPAVGTFTIKVGGFVVGSVVVVE